VNRVIVFGGYGTFGAHVSRELMRQDVAITVAGRNLAQAKAFVRGLGAASAAVADLSQPRSCRAALAGHTVAVNCAGPFQNLDATLLDACLDAGCHYADITDDRGYAALVRSRHSRFKERGLAAVYGCSSLPGISGALALRAREGTTARVQRVRVTLFVGNHNPKGFAAMRSLLAILGKPIAAPQGELRGFRDREVVPLPPPFGRRGVFNFQSPEYDLFPTLLDTRAVSIKVGFEMRLGNYLFALLALLRSGYGSFTARVLDISSRAVGWLGHSGGAVLTELFLEDGTVRTAAVGGPHDGQRMAALPCALAAAALARPTACSLGAITAYEFLGAVSLLEGLRQEGFPLHLENATVAAKKG
jgi:hypothetical protein